MLSCRLLAQDGTTVYNFLNLPFSPRQAALGDAVSVRDYDQNFAATNPALLNLDMDNRISINYTKYLAGVSYGTIAYAKDLREGHLLSFNARYLDYGTIPRTDEFGNVNGNFSSMDTTLGLGYAYQFSDDWTIGANINIITSKIDTYNSMALTGNLGVTYYREDRKESFSFVFRNLGYQFRTYNGTRENMPVKVDAGYTRILPDFPVALTITAHDLQKWNISSKYNENGQKNRWTKTLADHFSFGAELFPENTFNVRLGYNIKRGSELTIEDQRSFTGLSFGFGIRISYFKFDYTHARYHNSSNLNQIGLTMDLIQLSGNRR